MPPKRVGLSSVNQQARLKGLKALLVFSRRHAAFQLFEPVLDGDELG